MQLIDILYTPLDVPNKPNFNLNDLKDWLEKNYIFQAEYKNLLAKTKNTAEEIIHNYPWNLTVAYWKLFHDTDPGWLGNFDKQFPELSMYLYECFGLNLEDVGLIIFLPIRENHIGLGFWHNDDDWFGLRHYFCFEESSYNKLLLKKTKIPYNRRQQFNLPIDEDRYLQNETFECKIISTTQSFFLNNVRAVHSTWTEIPNVTRIACFVTGKIGKSYEFQKKIEKLVIGSALKYKDYAILY